MSTDVLVAGAGRVSRWALKIDRVVLAYLLIVLLLAGVAPAQVPVSLLFTADALLHIALFLAVSVVIAAWAKASGADAQIARVFSHQRRWATIVAAALFGALSPFCSCGVIPIIAALLAAGVPLPPVMAFWIASPLMDPEMFVLTFAEFDVQFTLARVGSAILMGLGAGFVADAAVRAGWLGDPLPAGAGRGCASSCGQKSLEDAPLVWRFWTETPRRAAFLAQAGETAWFLGKWLALAFLIESLMIAYLPADAIGRWLGGEAWWTIPASAAVGVPTYLNGYAAIPTISRLLDFGMAPGAALAFMTAGEVTSIPAAMAVFAVVRRSVFAWYIAIGLGGSILVGIGYQLIAA